ncbi:hypothetical protein K431DRAFT_321612 [Polychaeton citri CBS 116435]|uniref:AAA+ ATPase domain-containing protein n=1 Tax=Polychaeton citri CBS 116435 TaxID=1314669 RepID=A0A9P4Q4E7_9PEZI|nr:hypothetical protein K431DRAFT_321612 [Polychaeton citri CBS 116435]
MLRFKILIQQTSRLQPFFSAVIQGKRTVKNKNDAAFQGDPATCVQKLVASENALTSLRIVLRSDVSADFINKTTSVFLNYISNDADVLAAAMEPPLLWDGLTKAYRDMTLTPDSIKAFANLLFNLMACVSPSSIIVQNLNILKVADKALARGDIVKSPDSITRALGYGIQDSMRIRRESSFAVFDNIMKPGGRHDNDFEDFRQIAVLPTRDELLCANQLCFLRADEIHSLSPMECASLHLDNPFRLLREDMLVELRSDLQNAYNEKPSRRRVTRLSKLRFHGIHCGQQRKRRPASFAMECASGLPSLAGCLLARNEVVSFATIDRDEELLIQDITIVFIRILDDATLQSILLASKTVAPHELEFVQVDTPLFAYRPILKRLQEMLTLPLAQQILNESDDSGTAISTIALEALASNVRKLEGQNLRAVLQTQKDLVLDLSQTKPLAIGLTRRILVLSYTNHALDRFLEDILGIGVHPAGMLRLGSKSTPKTKSLSLFEQRTRYKRLRDSYRLMNQYSDKVEELSEITAKRATAFKVLQVSVSELLDRLQFSESGDEFLDAFEVPAGEDGMQKMRRKNQMIKPYYLINRWRNELDAGVFQKTVGSRHLKVWGMNNSARSQLCQNWIQDSLMEHVSAIQESIQRLKASEEERTSQIIESKRIIECTTTRPAQFATQLAHAIPGITFVEEAGEILESHSRSKIANYNLSIEKQDGYNLNVSLFERLVSQGISLMKQHRMRPDISALVRRLMYPELEDDGKTSNRPRMRELQSNVVFFDHPHLETNCDEGASMSRENLFEVEMVLKAVRYLEQQGYVSENQVVLTPLNGKRSAGLMPACNGAGKRKLRISNVENYQGEESDIIIVSLTRSNINGDIGFVSAPQRLNVLLSRARNGLIMIGNAATFLRSRKGSGTWKPFFDQLKAAGFLYVGVPIKCERHPLKTSLLRNKGDFDVECPEGGCNEPYHSKVKCKFIMEDKCPMNHKLTWECHKQSGICKKCEAEAERETQRNHRDHQLNLKRQECEAAYAIRLAEIDAEIKHEQRRHAKAMTERLKQSSSSRQRSNPDSVSSSNINSEPNNLEHTRSDSHIDQLMEMIGLEAVKQSVLDVKAKVDTCIRQDAGLKDERFGAVLLGNPGTGKTTVARLYAKCLASMAAIPGSSIKETTGARLASDGVKAWQKMIEDVLNEDVLNDGGGGAIFIDEAYQLTTGSSFGGASVLDYLLAEVENLTAGYNKQMKAFFAHNQGLCSRFPRKPNRIAARRIGYGRGKEGFGNARAVENLLSRITTCQARGLIRERRAGNKPDDFLLTKEDLIGPGASDVLTNNSTWAKLINLTGLESVKQSVNVLVESVKYNYDRELKEQPLAQFNLNKVFLGSPSTGKTTVAKLYGQLLADISMLSTGEDELRPFKDQPADFVGDVLGASEKTTKGISESTRGKVLVIDEAYGLHAFQGDIYKTAVIDTLVAEIQSVPGDDRCVLLLGYKDKMESMFQNVNPGLSRRFAISEAFMFEDFTDDQLKTILLSKLKQQAYKATDQAINVAIKCLKRARNRPNFGNAGEIDILLDKAKMQHQQRRSIGTMKDSSTLEAVDIDLGFDRAERGATNIRMLFKDVVGMDDLICQLKGCQKTVANMKARGMDPVDQIPFNFLFSRPPGTGKTTTARKMGKVYYDMGFLSTADVTETSATDLTGNKTRELLEKSLGRVLLAQGDFAKEAMDEMVDCLTKPEFAGKLVVILAGYDADISRLMSIDPGLTSRFPENVKFAGLKPSDSLELFTKLLMKKQHLDFSLVENPPASLRQGMLDRFTTLSGLLYWANARGVGTLAKNVDRCLLRDADPQSPRAIMIKEETVIDQIDAMIIDRSTREKYRQPSILDMILLPPEPSFATTNDSKPARNINTATSASTTSLQKHEEDLNRSESEISPDSAPTEHPQTDMRDPKLQLDKHLAVERKKPLKEAVALRARLEDEQAEQERLDAEFERKRIEAERAFQAAVAAQQKQNEEDMETRRRLEQERIACELARRKRQEELETLRREVEEWQKEQMREMVAQQKLRQMGICVAGFRWIKQTAGYRCAGGAHWVLDQQLGL